MHYAIHAMYSFLTSIDNDALENIIATINLYLNVLHAFICDDTLIHHHLISLWFQKFDQDREELLATKCNLLSSTANYGYKPDLS